jgi:dephospho-CoA kinase
MPATGSRPLRVAVTGGIASGKSALTERFAALGVPVIDADVVARELVEVGQPALAEIAKRFGDEVIFADGSLDRASLRRRVFADPAERAALDALLHPRVRVVLRERADAAKAPYVLLAIPLLVEGGAFAWIERTLVVDVPVTMQVTRLMVRDRSERATAERMVAAQATREQRLAVADDVVVNDGTLEALDGVVRRLDAVYRAAARR